MKRETASRLVVAIVLLFIGGAIFSARYQECRARGFSEFYCATN